MCLTLWLLGAEVFAVEYSPLDGDAADETYIDAGTTGHYSLGFVAAHEIPQDVALPQRTPAWDDEE